MPVSKRTAVEQSRQPPAPSGPTPYWRSECGRAVVYVGDCREVMSQMEPGQFHAVVTDPPYGLEFMGKEWDAPWKQDGSVDARRRRAAELGDPIKAKYLRHGVTYGGVGKRSRGHIGVADEGTDPSHPFRDGSAHIVYELSDQQRYQAWFLVRAEEMLRVVRPGAHLLSFGGTRMWHQMACAVEDAGWDIRDTLMWVYGTGFPKSHDVGKAIDKLLGAERTEVIGPGQAPLAQGQFNSRKVGSGGYGYKDEYDVMAPATEEARKWDGWGTALKPSYEPVILARRPPPSTVAQCVLDHGTGGLNIDGCRVGTTGNTVEKYVATKTSTGSGVYQFNSGEAGSVSMRGDFTKLQKDGRWPANLVHDGSDDVVGSFPNGAARFFYTAKADEDDRPHGKGAKTTHPTCKPLDLMRYLVRLVCAPGGTVLDPFMGSGSTGCAAIEEGMRFVGLEQSEEYADLAVGRLKLSLAKRRVEDTPAAPGRAAVRPVVEADDRPPPRRMRDD